MQQEEAALSPLDYAGATVPWLRRRRRAIAVAVIGACFAYCAAWLVIAQSARPELWMINDHTMHKQRVPIHESWPRPLAAVFAPAFRLDASCRPRYWAWTEEIRPWPPPGLLHNPTLHW